jgi:tetratricopeptide (TPR) repeat protein
MFSIGKKWISTTMPAALVALTLATAAEAQVGMRPRAFVAPDEARDIFNAGQHFYDESRFSEAENKFREVVRRFPGNPITDRADYYLIRTLASLGKRGEALGRINSFAKQYPRSRWQDDVQELRIQLTNQVPPRAEAILLGNVQSPTPAPFSQPAGLPRAPMPPAPGPTPRFSVQFQFDPEISLQREMMTAFFRSNIDRALEIANERLKADPADPVVLSSLHVLASSKSVQALSMLTGIAKNSPSPRARRDAIFWLGQARSDSDSIVDTIVGLLPALTDDDMDAVTYALGRVPSEKALTALTSIARDKNKSEKARNNAVYWIGQSGIGNRVGMLEDVYKNSMDNSRIRQQVMFTLIRTGDNRAVIFVGNVASSDPDIEVRKQAVSILGSNRNWNVGPTPIK